MAAIGRPGADPWCRPMRTSATYRTALDDCRGCEFWQDATQAGFSAGPPDAPLKTPNGG